MTDWGEKSNSSLLKPNVASGPESSLVSKTENIFYELHPFSVLHQETVLQSQWNKQSLDFCYISKIQEAIQYLTRLLCLEKEIITFEHG